MAQKRKLTHGPIVGAVSARSASIWGRASIPCEMEVRLSFDADRLPESYTAQGGIELIRENDCCGAVLVDGLEPDRRYYYTILLDGEPALESGESRRYSFQTFPSEEADLTELSFAFGSCFKPQLYRPGDRIFSGLQSAAKDLGLRFFLMVGDNVYADDYIQKLRPRLGRPPVARLIELYREAYRHTWDAPRFREFLAGIPTFMIFDDHEFWDNWGNDPADRQNLELFSAAAKAYQEYQDCHNPDFGERQQLQEGRYYYTFDYGPVGFFVLDCRTRRNPQATPFRTIMGEEQREALYTWLSENDARYPLKFIVSSVPISFVAMPSWIINALHTRTGDQWLGYAEERQELFRFISRNQIRGVHFLSGDIHIGQGIEFIPPGGAVAPHLYSYTSSPLANYFWLLPEKAPRIVGAAAWGLIGAILGAAMSVNLVWRQSPAALAESAWLFAPGAAVGGLILGGLAGALLGGLLGRLLRGLGSPLERPGLLGSALYWIVRGIIQLLFKARVRSVAQDRIQAADMEYRARLLFSPMWETNFGVVRVKRVESGFEVQGKIYDHQGKTVRAERPPHFVPG